ncbi:coA-transferase III family protein [Mycobacterium xenopi 4042]|uniref:CoA-transferase III family protein n=1 Tax=Mycobacterium xenopi 4042 TaxID=1299334 RepID=X8E415_MYCXE|nr:coA-transferase III family protein [Mycobacterium xenopi 4042]
MDYTVNAATGFPLVTGPANHAGPINHVLPAWDVCCGLYAALAVLAALRRRDHSGVGTQVSVALEDVALATAANLGWLTEPQVNGTQRPRLGNAIYGQYGQDFTSSDGVAFMVVTLTPGTFVTLSRSRVPVQRCRRLRRRSAPTSATKPTATATAMR